jgi:hypothetical protein
MCSREAGAWGGEGAGFRVFTCEVGAVENWESRGERRREGKREGRDLLLSSSI